MIHREPPLSYIPYTNDDQNTNCCLTRPRPRGGASRPKAWRGRVDSFGASPRGATPRVGERARVVRSLRSIAAFVRLVVGSVRDRAREREDPDRASARASARGMAEEDARRTPAQTEIEMGRGG